MIYNLTPTSLSNHYIFFLFNYFINIYITNYLISFNLGAPPQVDILTRLGMKRKKKWAVEGKLL